MNIWRLNVRETQITECIQYKLFAIETKPRNPEIQKGDFLLLQLVSTDARKRGKENSRVEFALEFDHYQEDHDGLASKYYWPQAGRTWRWILHCSDIVPTVPFSLEKLDLYHDYSGQTNPKHIKAEDMAKISSYILAYEKTEDVGPKVHRVLEKSSSKEYTLWSLLNNNDRIVENSPIEVEWVKVPEVKQLKRNLELPCLLKELYGFKCQVCGFDFKPRYGVPYSETHHVIWMSRGGVDHSNNIIVVCPNHHRIIHNANPEFDRAELAFVYPNGLRESLQLKSHLKDVALLQFQKIEQLSAIRAQRISVEKN